LFDPVTTLFDEAGNARHPQLLASEVRFGTTDEVRRKCISGLLLMHRMKKCKKKFVIKSINIIFVEGK